MTENKKNIAVLASGGGTNFQAILDAVSNSEIKNAQIKILISNKKDAYALERAKKNNIKDIFLDPKTFISNEDYDKEIVKILNPENIDLIVLAGYLKILTPSLINEYKKKIINIHPSLLPKFGGKGMYGKYVHEAVLKSKEKESGCTVHFVTEGIDEGEIICQSKVEVLPNDTVDTLAERVLKTEHKLLIKGINKALNGAIT